MPHRPEKMEGMERLVRHNGESLETDRPTWSRHRRFSGGQGACREVGSERLEENHRVAINGSNPTDEPVGQRRSKVEPALWGRRHLGSTPSHQGVCGRHGGEDASVTQGGLVSSDGAVWLE
jgi:hypothetical protein